MAITRTTIDKMPDDARQIPGSKDYVDPRGNIYTYGSAYHGFSEGSVIIKSQYQNFGYMYCGIYDLKSGKCKNRRVHRIVAEVFIENPDNLPLVGHKNNIKHDNRVENLYWTTSQENTQKAFDDKLEVNDKGFEDSQSQPVIMFNTKTHEVLNVFGSITEASKATGILLSVIARQAQHKGHVRSPFYFRFLTEEYITKPNREVGMYTYDDNELLDTYLTVTLAAKATGISKATILQQCRFGKPSRRYRDIYFAYLDPDDYKVKNPINPADYLPTPT